VQTNNFCCKKTATIILILIVVRTYPRRCVPATVWHTMSRQSRARRSRGHAAKPQATWQSRGLASPRRSRAWQAASCRGKAAHGEAAYNLVNYINVQTALIDTLTATYIEQAKTWKVTLLSSVMWWLVILCSMTSTVRMCKIDFLLCFSFSLVFEKNSDSVQNEFGLVRSEKKAVPPRILLLLTTYVMVK